MTGNVDEWTMDWWQGYGKHARIDPNNHDLITDHLETRSKITRGG